ncbi:MAG: hypothetical protein KAI06_01540 [Anaerolineales bacterium]|nr:hypothetical protein [Anaerolineales bacterium]
METDDNPQATITDLLKRRKLLVLLSSEYDDRLKFDNLREDERERSIEELRVLRKQIQSIDTALAELEDKLDVSKPDAQ